MATVEELEGQIQGLKAQLAKANERKREATEGLAAAQAQVTEHAATIKTLTADLKKAEKNGAALEALTGRASELETKANESTAALEALKAQHARSLLMADQGLGQEARDYFEFQYGKQEKPGDFGEFLASKADDPVFKAFTQSATPAPQTPPTTPPAAEQKTEDAPNGANGTPQADSVAALLKQLGVNVDPNKGVIPNPTPQNTETDKVSGLIATEGRTAAFEKLFGGKPARDLDA